MMFRGRYPRLSLIGLMGLLFLFVGSPAWGQQTGVKVEVDPEAVGIQGQFRPGYWTGVRLKITNESGQSRALRCVWEVRDIDGDRVLMEHVLGGVEAKGTRTPWLYAPIRTGSVTPWQFRVFDVDSGEMLGRQVVTPASEVLIPQENRAIAVTGEGILNLTPLYGNRRTQNEALTVIPGLSHEGMPNRWYGYDMLDAVIWTQSGGSPPSGEKLKALTEWVQRGGHLVVILGPGDSALQDWQSQAGILMPAIQPEVVDALPLPSWMGSARAKQDGTPHTVTAYALNPPAGKNHQAILTETVGPSGKTPLAVSHRVGVGRVTVIGVDLTSRKLSELGLPNDPALWQAVFGWRGRYISKVSFEQGVKDGNFINEDIRPSVLLDTLLPQHVVMQDRASAGLGLAMLLFVIYGLLAGPVSFFLLRTNRMVHWSWPVFVIIVTVFAAASWTGAYFFRPLQTRIGHFSVMTIDVESQRVHTHSWLSLFKPKHGRVTFSIDPAKTEGNHNVVSSSGLLMRSTATGFVDTQTYEMDAYEPSEAGLPFRSTARQLELDYLGSLTDEGGLADQEYELPQGSVTWDGNRLTGRITHGLPFDLTDVVIVFSDGDPSNEPRVWTRYRRDWLRGQRLDLEVLGRSDPLAVEPIYTINRSPNGPWGGFLAGVTENWQQTNTLTGFTNPGAVTDEITPDLVVQRLLALTFYDMLPRPRYLRSEQDQFSGNFGPTGAYPIRHTMRRLDLSKQLREPCLIVVGNVRSNAMLPVPVEVDGDRNLATSDSSWVMVRLIFPVNMK